jgi:hypothetical protein
MADQPYPDEFIITLPDPYLIAIGKVCVAWGHLEAFVDLSIGKFAGYEEIYDPRAAIVTAHMPWPLKMNILESLVAALLPDFPQLARFAAVKPLLRKAQDGRNRIVHGQWGYENNRATKLRATARGKLRTNIDPIAVADINNIVRDIGSAGTGLWNVVVNK